MMMIELGVADQRTDGRTDEHNLIQRCDDASKNTRPMRPTCIMFDGMIYDAILIHDMLLLVFFSSILAEFHALVTD